MNENTCPNQNGESPAPPVPDMSPEVAQLIRLVRLVEKLLRSEPEDLDTVAAPD